MRRRPAFRTLELFVLALIFNSTVFSQQPTPSSLLMPSNDRNDPDNPSGIRVHLASLFTNDAVEGSVIKLVVHVDARDLTFTKQSGGERKSIFDLVAILFSDSGAQVDEIHRTHLVRLLEDTYQRVLLNGLVYAVIVPVNASGTYQVRVTLS